MFVAHITIKHMVMIITTLKMVLLPYLNFPTISYVTIQSQCRNKNNNTCLFVTPQQFCNQVNYVRFIKIIWLGNQIKEILNLEHMKHNYSTKIILLTAFALPPSCICRSWSQVQFVSSWVERTNVTWTPKLLWTAEQSIHMNTPYVTLAQVGFLALQSKHTCKWIIYYKT